MAKTKILLNINCFFSAKCSCFKNIRVCPVAFATPKNFDPQITSSQRLLDQNHAGPHISENTTYTLFWAHSHTLP